MRYVNDREKTRKECLCESLQRGAVKKREEDVREGSEAEGRKRGTHANEGAGLNNLPLKGQLRHHHIIS